MKNWLRHNFQDWRQVKSITVNFNGITSSGSNIITAVVEAELPKPLIDKWGNFRWFDIRDKLIDENEDELNIRAKQLLKEWRSKSVIKVLKNGAAVTGKHIVKVNWDIEFEGIELTYDEVKEYFG